LRGPTRKGENREGRKINLKRKLRREGRGNGREGKGREEREERKVEREEMGACTHWNFQKSAPMSWASISVRSLFKLIIFC